VTCREEAERLYGHPLQYAFVKGLQYPHDPLVLETGELDDDAVIRKLRLSGQELSSAATWMLDHLAGYRSQIRIERYNRCPTCEQWSPCDVRAAVIHNPGRPE